MQRTPAGRVTYDQRLDADLRWALIQGSRHFEEDSAVFRAPRNVAQRLKDLDIPYAVGGGMALFRYGLRRFTEGVDLLVTRADLITIHDKLDGLEYLAPHKYKKQLKLASGMTNPNRLKDTVDVLELLKALKLPRDFALEPGPFVAAKFDELWAVADEPIRGGRTTSSPAARLISRASCPWPSRSRGGRASSPRRAS